MPPNATPPADIGIPYLQAALWLWCAHLSRVARHRTTEAAHTKGESHTIIWGHIEPTKAVTLHGQAEAECPHPGCCAGVYVWHGERTGMPARRHLP